jgi:serine/threonine protein kinase/tetratricopeptide (TPR) repeat protein
MIGQTVSRYKIVEKLGGGGMGVVYKAEDTKLGRFVALKFMPESVAQDRKAVERFMLEARAAAALSHPHICTIHEIDEFDGVPFIAMEYLEGQNLKYAIGGKPMPIELVIEMGIQTAEALAAAHAKGITHRDIKPSNIFITQGGQIKVVDFGLAKLAAEPIVTGSEDETIVADAPTQTADLTDSGTAMGTVSYMSPEQALGQDVDARTDLFSLGTVLYEMITGRQAFPGATQAAIFDKILNRVPPTPTRLGLEVPYELEQIVAKCLEKNKVLRYQSALEVHTDLRRVRRTIESGVSSAMPAADESYFDDHQISGTAPVPTPMSGSTAVGVSGSAIGVPPAQPGAPYAQAPSGSAPVATETGKSRRTLWILSALLLLAVAVIVGLMMRRDGPTALGESEVLLLTDVVNSTGDPVFDGTLKQALAVKLEESPYLNVLSERRVQETLGLMGLEASERITPSVGKEICTRQGIKAMVTGEIASLGNNYVISLAAEECKTGNSLTRHQIEVDSKEGVLSAVGKAAIRLREDLGESLATIEKFDAPVMQATTASLEAFKNLTTAEEVRDQGRETESIPLFQRALEIDPDFALAHARLGTVYSNIQEWDKAVYHKTRAYELRDRVTEKERLYITGHYYSTVTGELSKEIDAYQIYAQTYPRDWIPPNNLSSAFNEIGWYHKAAEEAEKARELAPDHPLPASNLAEAYRHLGRLDEAQTVLEEAFAKGLAAPYLFLNQFNVAYLRNDQAGMDQAAASIAGKPRESDLLILQAQAAASRGRLQEAEQITTRAIESAKSHGFHERTADYLARLARWEATFGSFEKAAERATVAMETATNRDSMPMGAITFALSGETEEAELLIFEMSQQFPSDTYIRSVWIPLAEAMIELQNDNPDVVLELLTKGAPYERSNLIMLYIRGRALGLLDRHEEALTEFNKIVELRGVEPTDPIHTLVHFGLARTSAALGDTTAARRHYENFFSLMADADDGLPTVETARQEYAALQ